MDKLGFPLACEDEGGAGRRELVKPEGPELPVGLPVT
jgi:hypothetical protein